ncbi:4,5-dihydroxyphthalate decarboxylase [Kutzneria sp. CA-103260]|nr:4,5-dihydroxyphthalate decarboxylase [Kutzneria sp. CA-103260]
MEYDRTRALFDGSVRIEGVDATFESGRLASDVFERMVRDQAFDVAELGLTFYLRTLAQPDPPFVAIPVFPARQFRHAAIFVNTASGIERPRDLVGKTIGEFGTYGHDVGVTAKGLLADDYGVTPDQCRWVIGGADFPMTPFDFVPLIHPADVDVSPAPAGRGLSAMLESGEIDALISARVPQCIVDGSPRVRRLFPDYETVERNYYSRTGIYPIMHTLVVRRDLAPDVMQAVYRAFTEAKDVALNRYRHGSLGQHMDVMVPWFTPLWDRNHFPDDFWAYGIDPNRAAIDSFLRHFHEQGLSERRLAVDEIFADGDW